MPYVSTSPGVFSSFRSSSAVCASASSGNIRLTSTATTADRIMSPPPSVNVPDSQHVEKRARGQTVGVPESALAKPLERLRGVVGIHDAERRAILEHSAERDAARPAHLDQREMRHVVYVDCTC